MTLRTSASLFLASLLAASFGAAANAQTPHHRQMHHGRGAHHSTQAGSSTSHGLSGNAATDALNEQSLNSARAGTTPTVTNTVTAPSSMPAQ